MWFCCSENGFFGVVFDFGLIDGFIGVRICYKEECFIYLVV